MELVLAFVDVGLSRGEMLVDAVYQLTLVGHHVPSSPQDRVEALYLGRYLPDCLAAFIVLSLRGALGVAGHEGGVEGCAAGNCLGSCDLLSDQEHFSDCLGQLQSEVHHQVVLKLSLWSGLG